MNRLRMIFGIVILCSMVSTVYAQEVTLPVVPVPQDAIGNFAGYVLGAVRKLDWPSGNNVVFGYSPDNTVFPATLRIAGWYRTPDGGIKGAMLISLNSSELTSENYKEHGDQFVAAVTAFYNECRAKEARGEVLSPASFITDSSPEEEAVLQKLFSAVDTIAEHHFAEFHTINPRVMALYPDGAILGKRRVAFLSVMLSNKDGSHDQVNVAEVPFADMLKFKSDKDFVKAAEGMFVKAKKYVQSHP